MPTGREERRLLIEVDDTESRMNDAKCDPAGRLFTGTMTHDHRRSALYRVDPDGTVTTVFTGLGISNGLGWSPDGGRMYFIDTPTLRVDAMTYDQETGTVGDRHPLIEVADGEGFPDGMTVDADGCLWVAFWDGGCVRRYDAGRGTAAHRRAAGRSGHQLHLRRARPGPVVRHHRVHRPRRCGSVRPNRSPARSSRSTPAAGVSR